VSNSFNPISILDPLSGYFRSSKLVSVTFGHSKLIGLNLLEGSVFRKVVFGVNSVAKIRLNFIYSFAKSEVSYKFERFNPSFVRKDHRPANQVAIFSSFIVFPNICFCKLFCVVHH